VELPAGADVLIVSDELERDGRLPQDTTVWLYQAGDQAPFAAGPRQTEQSIRSDQRKEGR